MSQQENRLWKEPIQESERSWNFREGSSVLENPVAKQERVAYNNNRLRKFPLLQTATTVKNYRRNTRGKRDDYCTGFWRPV